MRIIDRQKNNTVINTYLQYVITCASKRDVQVFRHDTAVHVCRVSRSSFSPGVEGSILCVLQCAAKSTEATSKGSTCTPVCRLGLQLPFCPFALISSSHVVLHRFKRAPLLNKKEYLFLFALTWCNRDASAISVSLFLIVMASVLLGSALPFGLARSGVDPAHAGTSIQVCCLGSVGSLKEDMQYAAGLPTTFDHASGPGESLNVFYVLFPVERFSRASHAPLFLRTGRQVGELLQGGGPTLLILYRTNTVCIFARHHVVRAYNSFGVENVC